MILAHFPPYGTVGDSVTPEEYMEQSKAPFKKAFDSEQAKKLASTAPLQGVHIFSTPIADAVLGEEEKLVFQRCFDAHIDPNALLMAGQKIKDLQEQLRNALDYIDELERMIREENSNEKRV